MADRDDDDARRAIVDVARRLGPLGLTTGVSGNVSTRAGAAMLITPSATAYETLAPADLALVELDGRWAGGLKPSTEWPFHAAIYAARPDVGAIVHAHPPYATALALLRRGIPPVHYMIAAFGGGDVRCAPYAAFGSAALASHAVAALEARWACLLANHGVIAAAPTLGRALWLAVELETLARHYVLACGMGEPVRLTAAEIEEARAKLAGYGGAA